MVMSFLSHSKRRKCKLNVKVTIQELLGVPYINGMFFCKVRLINGGSFESFTARRELLSTSVLWDQLFAFEVKLFLNSELRKYEDCLLRISVRKELKGGKTLQKLGFVDYNLADYLNKSEVLKRVLKGYDDKTRYDNSYLKIHLECAEAEACGGENPPIASAIEVVTCDFAPKGNASVNLLQVPSNLSANKSVNGHSRTSSKGSSVSFGHQRNFSNGSVNSGNSDTNARHRARKILDNLSSAEQNPKIIETRHDHVDVVDEIEHELNQMLIDCSEGSEAIGDHVINEAIANQC